MTEIVKRNGVRLRLNPFPSINALQFEGIVVEEYELTNCTKCAVRVLISPIFEPYAWLDSRDLEYVDNPSHASLRQLEAALGMPSRAMEMRIGVGRKITHGLLQSWLYAKAVAKPGEAITELIKGLDYQSLCILRFSEDALRQWLETNDTRTRRPQISRAQTIEQSVSIRRPPMGGA